MYFVLFFIIHVSCVGLDLKNVFRYGVIVGCTIEELDILHFKTSDLSAVNDLDSC